MKITFLSIFLSVLLLLPIIVISYCNIINYITVIELVESNKDDVPMGKNTPNNQNISEEEEHIYMMDNFTPLYVVSFTSLRNVLFNKKPLFVFIDVQTQPPLIISSNLFL